MVLPLAIWSVISVIRGQLMPARNGCISNVHHVHSPCHAYYIPCNMDTNIILAVYKNNIIV